MAGTSRRSTVGRRPITRGSSLICGLGCLKARQSRSVELDVPLEDVLVGEGLAALPARKIPKATVRDAVMLQPIRR